MQSVARFRVVSPLLAVHLASRKERFVTVPTGACIETSAALDEPGLVEITVNGAPLLAFLRDITERTERIEQSRMSALSA